MERSQFIAEISYITGKPASANVVSKDDLTYIFFLDKDQEEYQETYKIIKEIDGAKSIGPILMGMDKAVHVLQLKASVEEIVNMSAIAVIDAQSRKE